MMAALLLLSTLGQSVALAQNDTTTANEVVTDTTHANDVQKEEISQEDKQKAEEELRKQQEQLQTELEETEKKLAQLEKESKVTGEYIDTLDRKIGYMNEQLTILENHNTEIQSEIDKLIPDIEKNEKELEAVSKEVERSKNELARLEKKFKAVYDAYCLRLRVIYISGDYNLISALITCKDISSLLTRYEMIKSVAKSNTRLLNEVQEKTQDILTKQDGLNAQLEKYEKIKNSLDTQKSDLVKKQKNIESNSQSIAEKKAILATDRAECDRLLAELTQQNKQYTEFWNEDAELMAAVESEIQALISGVKTPQEVTTAVASDSKEDTTQIIINKSDVYSNSDAVLNMIYPVPNHTSVSAGYPNYSSGRYHGGIDFPCPMGSRVVAVQNGIVITVKRLDYSYGYYVMIYHGTDSKGRSVVSLYAHNSSILVSNGDSVKKGQQIAKSGSTGNSTGPHCHFEIRFDGQRANPKNYLG